MNASVLPLRLNEKSHRYTLDGQPIPSVTTILDAGLPKPALKRWGERVVAETAVAQLDTLGSVLATMGRQPTIDALAAAPYERMKTAQVRGTAVHALAEQAAAGVSISVPEELAEHVRGYIGFLETFNVEVMAAEAMIANRTLWYAGKFDLLALINNRVWLLDIKTANNVYPETALQCAAYAHAELCIADSTVVGLPPVDAIGVVHVTADGTSLYGLGDIEPAFTEFVACLGTYKGVRRRSGMKFDTPLSVTDV